MLHEERASKQAQTQEKSRQTVSVRRSHTLIMRSRPPEARRFLLEGCQSKDSTRPLCPFSFFRLTLSAAFRKS